MHFIVILHVKFRFLKNYSYLCSDDRKEDDFLYYEPHFGHREKERDTGTD